MGHDRSDWVRGTLSRRRAWQVGAERREGHRRTHGVGVDVLGVSSAQSTGGGKARAARRTQTAPNIAVEPTPNSVRSCVAPAIGRGSPPALGGCAPHWLEDVDPRSDTDEDPPGRRHL